MATTSAGRLRCSVGVSNWISNLHRRRFLTTSVVDQPPMLLHVEALTKSVPTDKPSTIFLHGLLGQGRNLKTFAKQACAVDSRPGFLMDLRGHGKSRLTSDMDRQRKHSFATCVQDVEYTIVNKLSSSSSSRPPDTLVGHSWGGRMALQLAATSTDSSITDNLQRVWLVDTVPGVANASVEQVVSAVEQLQFHGQVPGTTQDLVKTLTDDYGLSMAIAQWLASSYNAQTGNFGFDLEVVQGILPDFGTQDFEGYLTTLLEKGIRVDLVRGGKNTEWEIPILNQLGTLERSYPNFGLHVLPKAGHWVHVDDLKGLVGLFEQTRC